MPAASLQLKDIATNDIRKAETQSNGAYTFPDLTFGIYELTISKQGFESQVFTSVQVQTARATTVNATLKVGGTTQTVTVVDAVTPLVETDANVLATTLDTKQVVNLPVNGRSVFGFALLVPGWASIGAGSTTGTMNNMPGGAIGGADFDGSPAISNRFRSGGFQYGTSVVQPRIEDVAEMTISTAQLDLSGTGVSAMRINMVTRRGTGDFHGRVFEDFRNTVLNANSWSNNARGLPRNILKLNDFGFSVGGPILKNKLFFFGTFAESIQPGSSNGTNFNGPPQVLSSAAQQGLFTYRDNSGALQTLNVLQLAGSAGFPSTVSPAIASQLQKINSVLNQGTLTPTSDPNLSTFNFLIPNRTTTYYPALRFDYNATDALRFNVSYAQTKTYSDHVNTPNFPGGIDPLDYASNLSNNKIAGFGADWTIRPTLINQFHAGYTYQYSLFDRENLGIDLPSITQTVFQYGSSLYAGAYPRQPISSLYPLFNFNDSVTWQHGKHSVIMGGGWFREQDHYWNGPGGYPQLTFGIAAQDPLGAVFTSALKNASTTVLTNAENLYAELTGRISSAAISGGGRPLDPATKQYKPFGAYNLDEVMNSGHVFVQDKWHITPNLTLNYGLRWDFVGDDYDVNGGYSSPGSLADFWGPTPVGAIFQPGKLGGVANPVFTAKTHVYNASLVNPQPAVALAWAPQTNGWLDKIFPKGKTVIRAGWSLRNYQEGAQNFWAFGSNSGLFFFQQGSLNADTSGAVGTFQPGSLFLGQPLPAYNLTPPAWSPTVSASALSFGNNPFFGMNPNIRQPYVEQWNFGIQREVAPGTALEVRYVGNLAMHMWMSYNLNEVNIFENGFLNEFVNAQNNLKINQANGKGNSFANNGLPGQSPLPIFTAAFGSQTSNFTNGTFITNLQTGAAGSLAQSLARSVTFFCNMVGSSFSPCASRGFTAPGSYPVNFWEVNPYTTGFSLNYLDAAGHSNYHAAQVELRQRYTHGMQFDLNYTLGKSLSLGPQNGYQANVASQTGTVAGLYLTDRNFRLNYGPSAFDIRHVFHASGTYDLPFGKGKRFLSNGRLEDSIFGGWTIGTILVMQSGTPTQMNGGYLTVNQNDAGVVFNGITPKQFQDSVGVYKTGNPWVSMVNPNLIGTNGAVLPSMITAASTAGVWGYRPFIYGPHWFNDDLSVNKTIPIKERVRFVFQAQFLNVTNHPTFSLTNNSTSVFSPQILTFGQSTGGPTTARRIEFRANIEF